MTRNHSEIPNSPLTRPMRDALRDMLARPGLPLGYYLRPVVVALEARGLAQRFETVVLTDAGREAAQRLLGARDDAI